MPCTAWSGRPQLQWAGALGPSLSFRGLDDRGFYKRVAVDPEDEEIPAVSRWALSFQGWKRWAAVLGLFVPTPGGVGGYHAAVQFALTSVFQVPIATATGVALIAHAVSFVPISIIGFGLFAASPARREGFSSLVKPAP